MTWWAAKISKNLNQIKQKVKKHYFKLDGQLLCLHKGDPVPPPEFSCPVQDMGTVHLHVWPGRKNSCCRLGAAWPMILPAVLMRLWLCVLDLTARFPEQLGAKAKDVDCRCVENQHGTFVETQMDKVHRKSRRWWILAQTVATWFFRFIFWGIWGILFYFFYSKIFEYFV